MSLEENNRRFAVVTEEVSKGYAAYVPDVPGCIVIEPTQREAVRKVHGLLTTCMEFWSERGDDLPKSSTLVEYLDIQLPEQEPDAAFLPKNKDPEFVKKTLYVKRSTMRKALRKFEDAGRRQESDLVENLLRDYVSGK